MEYEIWRNLFNQDINEISVPHEWNLAVDPTLQTQPGWLQYTQSTFGRFRCSRCTRWWNSAEVHILFLMKLDRVMRHGTVKMRIFKQECKRCSFGLMETPEITQENIRIVISNLVNRIQSRIYLLNNRYEDQRPVVYSDKMEGPHNREHCESCRQNMCRWQ
ncbi:hypothetical protein GDO86_009993, partial [Hymenochirus boettgeri]